MSAPVALLTVTSEAAEAIKAGRDPGGFEVPDDYPTEFSRGMAENVGNAQALGPFFIARESDRLVVGEIGGSYTEAGVVEIGYAIVRSCWGHGFAPAAVLAFAQTARERPEAARLRAHTPFDRPESARVVEKAGFELVGEVEDEHEGQVLRVQRWELPLT